MTTPQKGSTAAQERPALVEAWINTNGQPPPKGFSTRLLRLALISNLAVVFTGEAQ